MADLTQHQIHLTGWDRPAMTAKYRIDNSAVEYSVSVEQTLDRNGVIQAIKDNASMILDAQAAEDARVAALPDLSDLVGQVI